MSEDFSITEAQVALGDVTINYAKGPDAGPPLVLVHGVTNWWQFFQPVMPTLGARWTAYVPDLRGHGKSSHIAEGYRWGEYAKDTVALIETCIREPVVLVGHSLGANVALQTAAEAPELVRALVLEEPVLYTHGPPRLQALQIFPFLEGYERLARSGSPEEILPALAKLHGAPDPEVLRGKANSLSVMDPMTLSMQFEGVATREYDTDAYLRALQCPVLVLRGEPALGSAISDEDWERASAQLTDCTVKQFLGLGHWISREKPSEFCDEITAYIDKIS